MEVISRLFNHTPATQGEISYFIHEFDNKHAKDDAFMKEIIQHSKNIPDNSLTTSEKLLSNNLPQLQVKLLVCCEMCNNIIPLDSSDTVQRQKKNDDLKEINDETFLKSISDQKEAINKEFNEAIEKLQLEYAEMEKQVERENSTLLQ